MQWLYSRTEREVAEKCDISQSKINHPKNSKSNREIVCMYVEKNKNINSSRHRRGKNKIM